MLSIPRVKVNIKCLSQKVKFGNGNHSFSSKLNYIITVTVPLLIDMCTIRDSGWISCCITMQIENNYKCSIVQRLGCKLNKLW